MTKKLFGLTNERLTEHIPNQTYNNYIDASNSNWEFAKEYFGRYEDLKLFDPSKLFQRKNVCIDALVMKKHHVFLIEIKRRQATFKKIKEDWNGELFLEEKKYKAMVKMKAKMLAQDPTREYFLHYISVSSDGYVMLWDLTFIKPNFEHRVMNDVTYGGQKKIDKKVALLSIDDARIQKTNITNEKRNH